MMVIPSFLYHPTSLNEFVVTVERKGVDDRDDRDKPLENSDLKETGQQGNDRDDRVKHAGISYIVKFIKSLLEHSFIEMTEPDKPNSRTKNLG